MRLFTYQEVAINHIKLNKYSALFLQMGAGKTLITLKAIDQLEGFPWLIVAPPKTALCTWQNEIEKWKIPLTYLHIKTPTIAAKILSKPFTKNIYIISDDAFYNFYNNHLNKKNPFKNIVIDEISRFRNHQANKFKAMNRLRPGLNRLIGLTGTPCPNGVIQLWGILKLLDQGERLGKTITSFRDNYFKPIGWMGHIVTMYKPLPGAEQKIADKIKDICISFDSDQYQGLPDFVDIVTEVPATSSFKTSYEVLKKEFILDYPEGIVDASTAAVLTSKLCQLVNGNVYLNSGESHHLHNIKLEVLKEIIDLNLEASNVLVFYNYTSDRDMILKSFKRADMLDIEKWQKKKQPIALLHPQSALGLNLQEGGHVMIWFGLPWSLENYAQGCKRLHRQGQTNRVLNYVILMQDTIDMRMKQVLEGKAFTQKALIQAVRSEFDKKR